MDDIKQIIIWCIKHWWYFAISVGACLALGITYYLKSAPKYNVEAVLMLRNLQSENRSNQEEMLQLQGFSGNKLAEDEAKVLSSRGLMEMVVDSLNLCTTCERNRKTYFLEQFPHADVTAMLAQPQRKPVKIKVRVKNNKFRIVVKQEHKKQRFKVKSLNEPLHTFVGDIALSVADTVKDASYRMEIIPKILVVEGLLESISIDRLSRESNIITLSTVSSCPAKSIATINTLLEFYNRDNAMDKYELAIQTEEFLSNRLSVVTEELNQAEAALESYKRDQQIVDITGSASSYKQRGEGFKQQILDIDDKLRVLDIIEKMVPSYFATYTLIPPSIGAPDQTIAVLIGEYNAFVAKRNYLLQTATEQNAVVVLLTEQINQKIDAINATIAQSRVTMLRNRSLIEDQQSNYDSRLAKMPQTERRYVEMSRMKKANENQFLFLIQKREENAMLLASKSVPAKVVDRAHLNPKKVSPNMLYIIILAMFFGMALPLSLYFLEYLRKEYL